MKSIALITGTYPPQKCGVGDYVCNLMQTRAAKCWKLFYYEDWSIRTVYSKIGDLKKTKEKIINIQYPSMGFGYSLVPHFICVCFSVFSKKSVTVTLHEYTRLGKKSRFAASLFLIFAEKLIFTNDFEREAAIKNIFFVKKKSSVIKIFSNIKPFQKTRTISERCHDVGYFGLLTPQKGLEDFLYAAKQLMNAQTEYQIYIMGQTLPEYEKYCNSIIKDAKSIGIKLFLNMDEIFVAEVLSNTKLCYLPYPDGVSERRGSFLAAVMNHSLILTTKGIYTTVSHETFCKFAEKSSAAAIIEKLLHQTSDFYNEYQNKVKMFIQKELPGSWEDVAESYNNLL